MACPSLPFALRININWKHGINALPVEKHEQMGRISIILWGWSDLVEEDLEIDGLGASGGDIPKAEAFQRTCKQFQMLEQQTVGNRSGGPSHWFDHSVGGPDPISSHSMRRLVQLGCDFDCCTLAGAAGSVAFCPAIGWGQTASGNDNCEPAYYFHGSFWSGVLPVHHQPAVYLAAPIMNMMI